ncbi:MAG: DUF1318 domain-containing protein [Thalassobaculaceae bacterium]|nr:DUF1318 domain-containing protein [Thalassobaculaceae bacterium]
MTGLRRDVSRRLVLGAMVGAAIAIAVPRLSFALDLATAKSNGWVGERRDGYLGIVDGAPADVKSLVDGINQERRDAYNGVAASNSVPLNQVEALAGQKLIDRAVSGTYIMDAAGRWIRK